MKYFKTLGLAVAATALMAAIGAGSASATVLCKVAVNPCPAEWKYPTGTSLDLSLEESTTWETNTPLSTCGGSTIAGRTSRGGSSTETVSVGLEAVQWFNCTDTQDTVELGELEIHWITGTNNGTVTDRGTRWTSKSIFYDCISGFSEWTDIGRIVGGSPARLEINVVMPGIGCLGGERWTARYVITQPTPLYVESS